LEDCGDHEAEDTVDASSEVSEDTPLVCEVPEAFDFQLVGEEAVNGRPAYV
jgi:hypothetical protein